MTHEKVLEKVIKKIPFPETISDIDITSEEDAVRFSWRGDLVRFRVTKTFSVEEVEDGFLGSNNLTIMLEALLRR